MVEGAVRTWNVSTTIRSHEKKERKKKDGNLKF